MAEQDDLYRNGLVGAYTIDLERREDDRGYFARMFCQKEFAAHGLKPIIAQANVGSNLKRGTLRGMHFQYPPAAEAKYVRCTRGAILDIIVDLRPESATYLEHVAVELTADNQRGSMCRNGLLTATSRSRIIPTRVTSSVSTIRPAFEGGLDVQRFEARLEWPIPVAAFRKKTRNGGCSTRSRAILKGA